MNIRGVPLRVTLLLFPIVLIWGFYVLRRYDYDWYLWLVDEDCPIEYLTSALYFLSAILATYIAKSFLTQSRTFLGASYALLACGMFFISGEEISWGQRIFDIPTPWFFLKNSSQEEINVHNLYPVQHILHQIYIVVGLFGGISWIAFLKISMPSLLIHPYLVPTWFMMSYFLPVSLFYGYYDYIMPYCNFLELTWEDQEPAELLLGMGFLLFISINRIRQIQGRHLSQS